MQDTAGSLVEYYVFIHSLVTFITYLLNTQVLNMSVFKKLNSVSLEILISSGKMISNSTSITKNLSLGCL